MGSLFLLLCSLVVFLSYLLFNAPSLKRLTPPFLFRQNSLFDDSVQAQGLLGSHFGVPGLPATYDYVIIGGGTAGLTVARRIAANTSNSVAVIEAGDFYELSNGNFSQVPAYASYFTGNDPPQKNPHLDWYHYTQPQPVSVLLPQHF